MIGSSNTVSLWLLWESVCPCNCVEPCCTSLPVRDVLAGNLRKAQINTVGLGKNSSKLQVSTMQWLTGTLKTFLLQFNTWESDLNYTDTTIPLTIWTIAQSKQQNKSPSIWTALFDLKGIFSHTEGLVFLYGLNKCSISTCWPHVEWKSVCVISLPKGQKQQTSTYNKGPWTTVPLLYLCSTLCGQIVSKGEFTCNEVCICQITLPLKLL